jgi:hypothetical protein
MVHAVQEKHPDVFSVAYKLAAEHREDLLKYELGNHGVICLGSEGEVLWKHPGHNLTEEELDAGVREVLFTLGKG